MDYMVERTELKESLDQKQSFQHLLYRRGYVVTNNQQLDLDTFPFYGNWKTYKINEEYNAYVHKEQPYHTYQTGISTDSLIMIGHAYNPFTGDLNEEDILAHAYKLYQQSEKSFFEYISELTGIHVIGLFTKERILFVQDCTAMEACFYGACNNHVYFLSHAGLLGDIDRPTEHKFIHELINSYAYNHWGTKYLPGDLTVYNELKRLGPNIYVSLINHEFSIHRFYPVQAHPECSPEDRETLEQIAKAIKKSVHLCVDKWKRPAISLSGGLDSRTTFAAANGRYNDFYYYSFHCKPQEKDDAEAAHAICTAIGVPHTIYPITDDNEDIPDFELFKKIVSHNEAYMHTPPDHEIRKYYFLSQLDDFDVELKSWASEIGRAYWEKRYGFSLPEQLTARDFSVFQTRFIGTPFLLQKNDKAYKDFLKRSGLTKPPYNYEHTDMFYWEYRFGSNGTTVTMEQQIFNFEVTMPMNNRKIMDMFLWYPHEFRKNDMVNTATILINEPKFAEIHHDVHNGYFAGRRIKLEGMYYKFRKLFYFSKT